MKIERGIIGFNNRNEMIVRSPGQIYHLNNESFFSRSLKENDKVLGVIVENKFNVIREYITNKGEFIYGYLLQKSKPGIIQSISNFNPNNYDPFRSIYKLGPQFIISL